MRKGTGKTGDKDGDGDLDEAGDRNGHGAKKMQLPLESVSPQPVVTQVIPPREFVSGLGQADGRHAIRQLRRSGQFDQGDVVADGQHVELGVLEDLEQAALLSAPASPARVPGTGHSTGTSRDPGDQWGPRGLLLWIPCWQGV